MGQGCALWGPLAARELPTPGCGSLMEVEAQLGSAEHPLLLWLSCGTPREEEHMGQGHSALL